MARRSISVKPSFISPAGVWKAKRLLLKRSGRTRLFLRGQRPKGNGNWHFEPKEVYFIDLIGFNVDNVDDTRSGSGGSLFISRLLNSS